MPGTSVSRSEAEVLWREFPQSLVERGLRGLELVTSDSHSGLEAARKAVMPSLPWQRCQFHLQQNASPYVVRVEQRKEVAADIRAIFNAPSRNEADRLLAAAVKKYSESAPRLSVWMEGNLYQGLKVMSFPVRCEFTELTLHYRLRLRRRKMLVGRKLNSRQRLIQPPRWVMPRWLPLLLLKASLLLAAQLRKIVLRML